MMDIQYRTELPNEDDLYDLYEKMGWNEYLKLDKKQLLNAMKGSYYSVYAYIEGILVGTGRVVSDGTISAYLCGLGVIEDYRSMGIGTNIINLLTKYCMEKNLNTQFFCDDSLVGFYERKGFTRFASGMTKAYEKNLK